MRSFVSSRQETFARHYMVLWIFCWHTDNSRHLLDVIWYRDTHQPLWSACTNAAPQTDCTSAICGRQKNSLRSQGRQKDVRFVFVSCLFPVSDLARPTDKPLTCWASTPWNRLGFFTAWSRGCFKTCWKPLTEQGPIPVKIYIEGIMRPRRALMRREAMKKHESASDDFEGLLSTPGKALTLIGLSTPERLRRAGEYIYIYIY